MRAAVLFHEVSTRVPHLARQPIPQCCFEFAREGRLAVKIFRSNDVTEVDRAVIWDGQLRGPVSPARGKIFTSGKKESVSLAKNSNISKNLEKNFLGVPCL